jgi:hypothetical protein
MKKKSILTILAAILSLGLIIVVVYFVRHPKEKTTPEASTGAFTLEAGLIETVFNWDEDRCEEEDIPDLNARAFIDDQGNVQLLASHYTARRFIGDNLNQLTHPCDIVFTSDKDPTIRNYNDYEWIGATYTLDGKNIYALIHNEYHGWEYGNCNSSENIDCWWNSINLAVSTNSGRSYSHASPPGHNILASLVNYNPNSKDGGIGFFNPSKIVAKDGYYYVLLQQHNYLPTGGTTGWGNCLMRTNNLADPASWRLWNGTNFYQAVGQVVAYNVPNTTTGDISYNTYLKKYISISCGWGSWGCYYAISDDLIHWQEGGELMVDSQNPGSEICAYPSIIQPGDPTRNFEQSSRSPWIYYTQCGSGQCSPGCSGSLDRDLKRVRIRFTKPGDEGRYELLDLQMNEKKGTQTLDSAFYTNDGSLSGNVAFGQEGSHNFLRFNGGKIEVADNNSLDISGNLSISANIRTSATPAKETFPTIVRKEEDSKRNYGLYLTDQGKLHFSFTGTSSYGSISKTAVNNGAWHQVTITYDQPTGMVRYYLDGQLDGQYYYGSDINRGINSANLIIGDQGFNGDIDSLTIYNYLLIDPPATPTPIPTKVPTSTPTPTPIPTKAPTSAPTSTPKPTATPTRIPTTEPTQSPTTTPTPTPTAILTETPTIEPTGIPTAEPTTIEKECLGGADFNNDGVVDEFDYGILIAYFNQTGKIGELEGDANCDGVVDEFDYGILIAYFGQTS